MQIVTIGWKDNAIRIIDQTKLPSRLEYLMIRDLKTLWSAIRELKVRGAPALGAAAALGVYLGVKDSKAKDFPAFAAELDRVIRYIGSSRPTARNLFWALERMASRAVAFRESSVPRLKKLLFDEAMRIIEEDRLACRRIGAFGEKLLRNGDSILTICNAGILATIDYGTALGVIYRAQEKGKRLKVYACETRPLLQGARLTVWELRRKGVDVTLICDSMAAALMKRGMVDKVITGADRIAANGDVANKIGTYSLAVLAAYHKLPFYVAAPFSTFDLSIARGERIIIEERPGTEVCACKGVKVFNPAFDVTGNRLVSAIITDLGIIRPPYIKTIAAAARKTG